MTAFTHLLQSWCSTCSPIASVGVTLATIKGILPRIITQIRQYYEHGSKPIEDLRAFAVECIATAMHLIHDFELLIDLIAAHPQFAIDVMRSIRLQSPPDESTAGTDLEARVDKIRATLKQKGW